ncbi:hypothetical protein F511_03729 [Dorcoceras hygrometricum]|uniref:Uncharacterized protein n=1 Tax=Dorcoceras hygrometricum TaxID=472368 RepID=A0A2Z7BFJ0_9LAMI|nr:hypothetical protein F511_03729 [Dorcoceras hygrometricum]
MRKAWHQPTSEIHTVKNNEKRWEQILAHTVTTGENVIAHHNQSRRSKKKYKSVDFSEVCEHDIEKHAKDSSMCLTDATKSVAAEGLEVEVETKRTAGSLQEEQDSNQLVKFGDGQQAYWKYRKMGSESAIKQLTENMN